ncbi:MAG: dCTP deaminase [Conexivisphaerales archaeon]
MILSDAKIIEVIKDGRMKIEPENEIHLTPNGIDFCIGDEVAIIKRGGAYKSKRIKLADQIKVEPDTIMLAATREVMTLGNGIVGLVGIRSSYARRGFTCSPTIIDAGYSGRLTLQLRTPPYPVTISKGERVWHIVFFDSYPSSRPYNGRYQGVLNLAEG